jgi:DNA-nicking Smr family endonuclease
MKKLSEDDKNQWKLTTKDVTPLGRRKKILLPKEPQQRPVIRRNSLKETLFPLPEEKKTLGVERLPRKKARTLFPEASLDLHGYTCAEAERRLTLFLRASQEKRYKWVKIITGKSGLLFTWVPQFLHDHSLFSSGYVHAADKDGGQGVLLVRIRQAPPPKI